MNGIFFGLDCVSALVAWKWWNGKEKQYHSYISHTSQTMRTDKNNLRTVRSGGGKTQLEKVSFIYCNGFLPPKSSSKA